MYEPIWPSSERLIGYLSADDIDQNASLDVRAPQDPSERLDMWLDAYEHDIEFNLAASTGPAWTVNDILALANDETRQRFLNHNLAYSRVAGADRLREEQG